MADVNAEILRLLGGVGSPHLPQDMLLGDDFSLVLREQFEELVFDWTELEALACGSDFAAGVVEGEAADGLLGFLTGAAAALDSVEPGG